ncbi:MULTISPECIES: fibronectin type III domain-containing protein [Bacillus cereus group]|uniref:fibronectin type III domain-containing protein n=1 Tax=Bacillus cereus group TaxID=86661 RepID=UPI0020D27864|nr:fibronectin type III domain-containing protein [Bacillus thuringiensis]WLP67107.1 fibronectin type III domain-containing protein [Bacillus thuringiensis]
MATHVVNSMYSGSTKYPATLELNDILQFNPTSTGRLGTIMKWVVPISGKYNFTVAGAKGGSGDSGRGIGGQGIIMTGTVALKKDEVVQILVGQQGKSYPYGGGGGGGSFTAIGSLLSSAEMIIVSGGGGGGGSGTSGTGNGANASNGLSGTIGPNSSTPVGGINGNGGRAAPAASCPGGGGGGFYGDGESVSYSSGNIIVSWETALNSRSYTQGGRAFHKGGEGGLSYASAQSYGVEGGFGGGAGNGFFGGGGGGGYSGGAAGRENSFGGGGGGSAANTDKVTAFTMKGYNTGHGYVTIQFVQRDSRPPTVPTNLKISPSENNVYLTGETISISWAASTDPEGDAITYDVDFYNGSSWVSVTSKITDLSVEYILPSGLNITTAKVRVRAVDNKASASSYQESEVFTVRKQLLLVQDGDNVKTYSNGVWTSI